MTKIILILIHNKVQVKINQIFSFKLVINMKITIFLKIKLIIINLMNNYFKNINEYFRKLLINKILIKFFFVGHGYLDDWSIKQRYIKKKLFIKFFLQQAYNSSHAAFFSTINELEEAKKNLKIKDAFIIPNGLSLKKYTDQMESEFHFVGLDK